MAETYVKHIDPLWTFSTIAVAASTTIHPGDPVSLESNALNDVDAKTDDATFCGISEGETVKDGSQQTTAIVVHRVCICDAPVTSGTYTMGLTVQWAAGPAYAADTTDSTIGWIHDNNSATRTRALIMFNVFLLAITGKLYQLVKA